ncbi:MAG TPA: hypothetical protein VL563_15975 [Gemmatimonadales bacterium]|jgi:hypothetical protein|nr:hypothetical protein [Gemmatimonadales bacterium]
MTLGRLVLAWVPVALWFVAAGWVAHRVVGVAASPAPAPATFISAALESLVATLFASLWFDSLGHGGWWVLFALVGVLAAGLPSRPSFAAIVISVTRFLGAGAILAWRLR